MGRKHNGIDYDEPHPPPLVYVVTRDRLRAGKGVLRIHTHRWVPAENMPMGISGSVRQNPSEYGIYALMDCFLTLEDAISCAQLRIENEIASERAKYHATAQRLREAQAALMREEDDRPGGEKPGQR